MATAVQIGEIVVTIRGDTKQMEQAAKRVSDALKGTEKQTKDSSRQMQSALVGLAARFLSVAAIVAAVHKAISLFQSTMADISAMDRLSQATGIAIAQLDSLRQVAEANGVQFTELTTILGGFNGRMREAASNATAPLNQALRALNINLRDSAGNLRTLDDLLPELADAFAGYSDGANKAAIANALFGEQGGPAMTRFLNQGSEAIRRQREELERTGRVLTEDGVEKAREYERVMAELSNVVQALARDFALMLAPSITEAARAINDFFTRMRLGTSQEVADMMIRVTELTQRANQLKKDLAAPGFWGAFANVAGAKTELENIQREIAQIEERMLRLMQNRRGGEWNTVVTFDRPQAPALPDLTGISDKIALIQERLGGMPDLLTTAFGTEGWSQSFIDAMNQMETALIRQGATADRIALMKINMQKREQAEVLNTASLVASTLTTVFAKSKTAAIAAATINTAEGITKALSSHPPPFNFINAALVAASGAAQIAAIRSTTQSGGGNVPTPTGAGEAAGEGGLNNTLTVQGVGPLDWIRGDTVRDLLDQIAEKQRDGYRVVLSPR